MPTDAELDTLARTTPPFTLLLRNKENFANDNEIQQYINLTAFQIQFCSNYIGTEFIENYDNLKEFLPHFSTLKKSKLKLLFNPILFTLGIHSADNNKFDCKYFKIFKELIEFDFIKDLFEDEKLWGLDDHKYYCYFMYKNFGFYSDVDRRTLIFDNSKINRMYFRTSLTEKFQMTVYPAVIDPFLELFPSYESNISKSRVCHVKSILNSHTKSLISLLQKLIKHSKIIESNFINYLRKLSLCNLFCLKTRFRHVVSEKFVYNLMKIVREFSRELLNKSVKNIELGWFENKRYVCSVSNDKESFGHSNDGINLTNKAKSKANRNFTFLSAIYDARIVFTQSFYVMASNENKEKRKEMINLIMSDKNFADEKLFMEHLGDFIIYYHNSFFNILDNNSSKLEKTTIDTTVPFLLMQSIYLYINLSKFYTLKNTDLIELLLNSRFSVYDRMQIAIKCSTIDLCVSTILKLYVESNNVSEHVKYYLRNLLNIKLKNMVNLVDIIKNEVNCVNFLHCVIGDLELMFEIGIMSSKQFRIRERNRQIGGNDELFRDLQDLYGMRFITKDTNGFIISRLQETKMIFKYLKNLILLISSIFTLLISGRQLILLLRGLNRTLSMFTEKRCNLVNFGCDLGFDLKDLMEFLLGLYIKIFQEIESNDEYISDNSSKNCNNHIKSVGKKEKTNNDDHKISMLDVITYEVSSDRTYFVKGIELCEEHGILENDEIKYFKETIIKNIDKHLDKTDDVFDIPNEYLDPITYSVMKNPVRLRGSGLIVDFSTYATILSERGTDPYTNKRLDGFEEDLELEDKIRRFMLTR